MINLDSLRVVGMAQLNDHFNRPLYEDYSFARIPQTVCALLSVDQPQGIPFGPRNDLYDQYDAVVLLLIDAFGWRFFERFADLHPFLQRITRDGLVCKLSSQFPSTTSAHVTTIHTGQPVGDTGVLEWFYYEPLADAMIAPLLFSFAGDKERATLLKAGILPDAILPKSTLYQRLARYDVQSYVFQQYLYAYSPYSTHITAGSTIVPYRSLPESLVTLCQRITKQQQRSYYFLYYDTIDTICHLYGPDSTQLDAEIVTLLDMLERVLHRQLAQTGKRTLLLITADHGQVAINPQTTLYLNHLLPNLQRMMRTNRAGQPLVPGGSSRDMFLYITEQHLDEAQAMLTHQLAGKAEVYRVADLITQNFFGTPHPSPTFLSRVGNLVVLPYANESVWWYEQGRFEQHFWGSHGGLTPEELETILLVQRYN